MSQVSANPCPIAQEVESSIAEIQRKALSFADSIRRNHLAACPNCQAAEAIRLKAAKTQEAR